MRARAGVELAGAPVPVPGPRKAGGTPICANLSRLPIKQKGLLSSPRKRAKAGIQGLPHVVSPPGSRSCPNVRREPSDIGHGAVLTRESQSAGDAHDRGKAAPPASRSGWRRLRRLNGRRGERFGRGDGRLGGRGRRRRKRRGGDRATHRSVEERLQRAHDIYPGDGDRRGLTTDAAAYP